MLFTCQVIILILLPHLRRAFRDLIATIVVSDDSSCSSLGISLKFSAHVTGVLLSAAIPLGVGVGTRR